MSPKMVLIIGILIMLSSLAVFAVYDHFMAYLVFIFGFVLFVYARILLRIGRLKKKNGKI